MLTTFDMDDYVYDALQAGASGFLLKDIQPEVLVAGIHAVHAGESSLAPTVTRRMIETFLDRRPATRPREDVRLKTLTERELQTLRPHRPRAEQHRDRRDVRHLGNDREDLTSAGYSASSASATGCTPS